MGEQDTLLNAVIGAVATAVLSGFVPFAPVLGGAIAGYLEGGTRNEGFRVGAISGVIGLVLGAVFFAIVLLFLVVFVAATEVPNLFGAFGLLFLLLGAIVSTVYTVGLSALGGWVGNYVKFETNIGH